MRELNLENVQASEDFEKMRKGAYIGVIKSVFDNQAKEYLEIELDIADGEFKDYYTKLYEAKGFWGLKKYASYKEKALPIFKGMITAIEESNSGFKFQCANEKCLVNCRVGLVIGEEEYKANNGEVKTRLYIDKFRDIKKIQSGDYKIPELKKLKDDDSNALDNVPDNDLPF